MNNTNLLNIEDDDDKTIYQTTEDLQRIEKEISGLMDDDSTEVEITHQMKRSNRPYWQQVFG